jgi:hypothetical protein
LKHARNKRNKRLQLLDLRQKGSGNIKRTVRHKYKNIRKCTLETRHRKRAFTCPVKRPRILAESRSSKKPMSWENAALERWVVRQMRHLHLH